jgi:aspartate kinase
VKRADGRRTARPAAARRPGLIVQKYGVSAGDVRGMQNAWRRIKRAVDGGQQVVAVISAMGQDTDRLVELALRIRGRMPRPAARELDMLMASGEATTAPLVAIGLQGLGVPAVAFSGLQAGIRTTSDYGRAEIIEVRPLRVIEALERGMVPVIAGFQGATEDLDVTTLGRAGGDTTAVRLAAELGAELCEIYVNYDGIRTADPHIVPESRVLSHISYDEALELAQTGLHTSQPRAVEIARQFNVAVHLCPVNRAGEGTRIVAEVPQAQRRAVCAIAYEDGIGQVRLASVPGRPGAGADILEPLGERGISANMINHSALGDISFVVRESDLDEALRAVEPVAREMGASAIGVLDLVKVSAVGVRMPEGPGIAARMFRTLGDAGINIESIAAADIRITCLIERQGHERAVRALHSAFGLGRQ